MSVRLWSHGADWSGTGTCPKHMPFGPYYKPMQVVRKGGSRMQQSQGTVTVEAVDSNPGTEAKMLQPRDVDKPSWCRVAEPIHCKCRQERQLTIPGTTAKSSTTHMQTGTNPQTTNAAVWRLGPTRRCQQQRCPGAGAVHLTPQALRDTADGPSHHESRVEPP